MVIGSPTPNPLQLLEEALCKRLKELESTHNLSVGLLNAQKLREPTRNGQLFLTYLGDDPGSREGQTLEGDYVATVSWAVLLQYLDLQSHTQIYPAITKIRSLLNNFSPEVPNLFAPVYCGKGVFVFEENLIANGIWRYQIPFDVQIQYCEEDCC